MQVILLLLLYIAHVLLLLCGFLDQFQEQATIAGPIDLFNHLCLLPEYLTPLYLDSIKVCQVWQPCNDHVNGCFFIEAQIERKELREATLEAGDYTWE
jgi:hypothetical protein